MNIYLEAVQDYERVPQVSRGRGGGGGPDGRAVVGEHGGEGGDPGDGDDEAEEAVAAEPEVEDASLQPSLSIGFFELHPDCIISVDF